jgi:hypothetical protein
MKKKLFILSILLISILVSSTALFSQKQVEERPDLAQEIIEQAQVFSFEESEIKNTAVTVLHFQGTVEEAVKYAEENFFKEDSKKPKLELTEDNLVSGIRFFKAFAEQGMVPGLDEDWIKSAEEKENQLKDIKIISSFGSLEYPNYTKEITIVNPFFSPLSFKLEEGTYIIYSENRFSEEEDSQIISENAEMSEEKLFDFLIGDWKVQTRRDQEVSDSEMPEVKIKINELIGSVWEAEIETERYLFSGQIEINGEQYEAYEILDPVYMYEYPIRLISLVDEGNEEYKLEILVSRIDDYYFEIYSDFSEVNDNSIEIDLSYEGIEDFEDNYQTESNALDYLIRE